MWINACFIGYYLTVAWLRFMMFNATFNNISVIYGDGQFYWWRTSHWQTSSFNVVPEYTLLWTGFELTTLVVIGTDCIGSCKSNYHIMIMAMTAPIKIKEWKMYASLIIVVNECMFYQYILNCCDFMAKHNW